MAQENSKLSYYLLFCLAMILVGSSVVIGKQLTMKLPVFFTMGVRFFFSIIVFYFIVKIKRESFPKLNKRDYTVLFIQSATGIFLFNILLFYGLRFTSGVEAGIILSMSPAFVAIIAFLFLREKLTSKKWLGISLAILGIILVNSISFTITSFKMSMFQIIGNLMILIVALSEAVFTVTGKYSTNKLSPYQISLIITLIAFVLFLPLSIYESFKVDYTLIDFNLILELFYYAVFIGMVPYVLVYKALKHITATTAGVMTTLIY